MKIAVFYPRSQWAAWSLCDGVVNTLRAMGHDAVGYPVSTGEFNPQAIDRVTKELPTIETLKTFDAAILSGPEHIAPWIAQVYGKYEWNNLGIPRASWYHESFFREDYTIDFEPLKPMADEHFFPAAQDAEFHDQEQFAGGHAHWLPFGVDTEMFRNTAFMQDYLLIHGMGVKTINWPIGFIGLLYDKRVRYLNALARHNHPSIRVGNVSIQDLGGWQADESTQRLANNYRRIGVFFNLPAMSKLIVTKCYEVMACGTFLLTPLVGDGGAKNMEVFEDGKHCVFYRATNLPYVAQLLRDWSSDTKATERAAIGAAAAAHIRLHHSLTARLETILSKVGSKVVVQ